MKKLFLILVCGALVTTIKAQQSLLRSQVLTHTATGKYKSDIGAQTSLFSSEGISAYRTTAAKGTGIAFATETFGTGTSTTLPTGWTANTTTMAATWKWMKQASASPFTLGTLNSTTAADGWMIFDTDSIARLSGFAAPLHSYLTSPSYNCATHPSVLLVFQQYFRSYLDSCFVEVSNDNGTTWNRYSVLPNNGFTPNTSLPTNSHNARINISATAANQANVKVRFHYVVTSPLGGFSWLIDDMTLSELDPVDAGIQKPGMFFTSPNPTYCSLSGFSNIPASLTDSVYPFAFVSNYGTNSLTNLSVNAHLYRGTTSVYNQSTSVVSLPVNGVDTLAQWPSAPGYLPAATGSYTSVFSTNAPGDAYALNNTDTFRFGVTDTVFTVFSNQISGGFYIHRPSTGPGGEASFFQGSRFDIPVGKSDTATSISVSFQSATTPGVTVIVQVYKLDMSILQWTPVAETFSKVLTASDISTTGTLVSTTFKLNSFGGTSSLVLEEGTYAVVVSSINALATATIVLLASTPLYDDPRLIGFVGQSGLATNTGAQDFGGGTIATGTPTPALIALNFGRTASTGIAAAVSPVYVGHAYPNPAHTTVTIPVTPNETAQVDVQLSNMVGQVLATQHIGQLMTHQTRQVVFNTADLAAGIYMITVTANGIPATSRIVVAH